MRPGSHRPPCFLGALLSSVLAASSSASWAGGSRFFEIDDFRKVAESMDLEGASLTADGGVTPAPSLRAYLGPSIPVVWDLLSAEDGGIRAAGGAPGTVLAFPARGEGRVLAEIGEAEITALASLGGGRLAAASSPGGRVFEVGADGRVRDLFVTGSRYVWDLLGGEGGDLWVAAGDPGAVFAVDRAGTGRLVLNLGMEQARCLARSRDGALLIGTSGSGRIESFKEGRRRVLLDSEAAEVVTLAPAADGSLFAALATAGAAEAQTSPAGPETSMARGAAPAPAASSGPPPPGPPLPGVEAAPRSQVIRLDADGGVERVWASEREVALSLLVRADGSLWIGTAPRGGIDRVRADRRVERLVQLGARAVTALLEREDGSVLAATAGLGGVSQIGAQPGGEAIVSGPVHDAGTGAVFGGLTWWARQGGPEAIALSARSGNTARPDPTWSDWSAWREGGEVAAPAAPPGRYMQWRARIRDRGERGPAAELARVRATYLPRNQPPGLQKIEVLSPGVVLEMPPAIPGQLQPPAGSTAASALGGEANLPPRTPRRQWSPGRRTLSWEAVDDDGDPLRARVLLRADGEAGFTPFADAADRSFLVFDEAGLADGGYTFRVEVSDREGNTADRARQVSGESPRFVVDRTPPVIGGIDWRPEKGGSGRLTFAVRDGLGPPTGTRVTVDDRPPVLVLPVDGVEDRTDESYRLDIRDLAPGDHVVTVQSEDGAGNVSSARLTVQVPAQEKARR